jgi:hypothetical protein
MRAPLGMEPRTQLALEVAQHDGQIDLRGRIVDARCALEAGFHGHAVGRAAVARRVVAVVAHFGGQDDPVAAALWQAVVALSRGVPDCSNPLPSTAIAALPAPLLPAITRSLVRLTTLATCSQSQSAPSADQGCDMWTLHAASLKKHDRPVVQRRGADGG